MQVQVMKCFRCRCRCRGVLAASAGTSEDEGVGGFSIRMPLGDVMRFKSLPRVEVY